jgi:hypothetical protein
VHIGQKESKSVIRAGQRCRAKAFMIKEANRSARLLNFYRHIPICKKKQSGRRQIYGKYDVSQKAHFDRE